MLIPRTSFLPAIASAPRLGQEGKAAELDVLPACWCEAGSGRPRRRFDTSTGASNRSSLAHDLVASGLGG